MQARPRRWALLSFLLLACGKQPSHDPERSQGPALRVGYQKSGALALLRWRGTLEAELRGTPLEWAEFPTGPALLEALNADQLDLGFVGEAPPIFAQAASTQMVYVASEPPAPLAEAILVRRDSTLKSVGDLKGHSVALNKGSNVHYFVIKALERAAVRYADVKIVYLPPADARAAFENGTVDAWAIWDPYLAAAELSSTTRVLATAEGSAENRLFYVGRRELVEQNPKLVDRVLKQLQATDDWVGEHRAEAAGYLAEQLGLEPRVMRLALGRATFGVQPISAEVVESQQRVADTFHQLGLIPQKLAVKDALPSSRINP
jgi:sulfonate transport system substrate-binding protein